MIKWQSCLQNSLGCIRSPIKEGLIRVWLNKSKKMCSVFRDVCYMVILPLILKISSISLCTLSWQLIYLDNLYLYFGNKILLLFHASYQEQFLRRRKWRRKNIANKKCRMKEKIYRALHIMSWWGRCPHCLTNFASIIVRALFKFLVNIDNGGGPKNTTDPPPPPLLKHD